MAGRAKENLPGGNLTYQFVYLKFRIFKCSYRRHDLGTKHQTPNQTSSQTPNQTPNQTPQEPHKK